MITEDINGGDEELLTPTQEELVLMANLKEKYPWLYEAYVEYDSKSKQAMLAVSILPSSHETLKSMKQYSEEELYLLLVRTSPDSRASLLRRYSLGYEGSFEAVRKQIVATVLAIIKNPDDRTPKDLEALKRLFKWDRPTE